MSVKIYFFGLTLVSLLSWFCFGTILFFFNPQKAVWFIFFLFYLTLFLALVSSLTLIGFSLRRLYNRKEVAFYQMSDAFRQGFLLALVFIGSLILQRIGWLHWWSLLILAGGAGLIEYLLH